MTAYDAAAWRDLFVASTGAGAALAGLVFVAISINVQPIVQHDGLPARALETVLLLLGVVGLSIVGLIPDQTARALGVELVLVGGAILVATGVLVWRSLVVEGEPPAGRTMRIVMWVTGTVPYVIGGVSLIAGSGGGLYWVVVGLIAAMTGALLNAWVLLVEILR